MLPTNSLHGLADSEVSTESHTPIVSVVMPCYNGAQFVEDAIASIIGQTFTDFEFLIYDDGSSDGSWAIIAEWARRDQRVRATKMPHVGLVGVLNRGLLEARGRYIARMDADDYSYPDRLEMQVREMERRPDCVVLGGQATLVDAKSSYLQAFIVPLTHAEIDAGHLHGHGGSLLIHPAVLMRRDAVNRAGGYREQYNTAEDLDLWLRIAELGEIANLEATVLKYRWHSSNVTSQRKAKVAGITRLVREEALRRRHGAGSNCAGTGNVKMMLLTWWWLLSDKVLARIRRGLGKWKRRIERQLVEKGGL